MAEILNICLSLCVLSFSSPSTFFHNGNGFYLKLNVFSCNTETGVNALCWVADIPTARKSK